MPSLRDTFFIATVNKMFLDEPEPTFVYKNFVNNEISFEGLPGNTTRLTMPNRLPALGMSQSVRELLPSTTLGTANPVSLTNDQVFVTLAPYTGPFNSLGSTAPLAVEMFDLKRALGQYEEFLRAIDSSDMPRMQRSAKAMFSAIGARTLKLDYDQWFDSVLQDLFALAGDTYFTNPGNKANGATLITDAATVLDVATAVEKLTNRFIPRFEDGYYKAVIGTRLQKHLKADADYRAAESRTITQEGIRKGYLTAYEGVKFYLSPVQKTKTINSLTASLGYVFGADQVGTATTEQANVRFNENTDFQTKANMIWYAEHGFSILDARRIEEIRTFAA